MSQNATISEIKARILAIAAECAGVLTVTENPGDKWPAWAEDDLPAVIVRYAGTTRREKATLGLGSSAIRAVRDFQVIRYESRLPKPATAEDEKAAIEAAEEVADDLPNHFMAYPTLALDDSGIVFQTLPMTDGGAVISPYGGVPYGALIYTLPVITYTP